MKKQDILVILIPTLIFVFAWIGFNIYHSAVTPTITEQQLNKITPIDPNFDTQTNNYNYNTQQWRYFFIPKFLSHYLTFPPVVAWFDSPGLRFKLCAPGIGAGEGLTGPTLIKTGLTLTRCFNKEIVFVSKFGSIGVILFNCCSVMVGVTALW